MMKIIDSYYHKMNEAYDTLIRLIPKRIKDLYCVAKQKGINDFGWDDITINEDDTHITTFDEYIANEYIAYRFKFNNDGELVITEYYDYRTCKYVDNQEIHFSYTAWYNVPSMANIISMVEQKLGIES